MNEKIKILLKITGIILYAAVILIMTVSCLSIKGISGSGNIISEERKVEGFSGILVSAGINLFISQGSIESLKIEAEDNIIPLLITEVKNGKLEIHYKHLGLSSLRLIKPVNVYATVKELNDLGVSSGATVKSEEINTDSIKINLSSGASGELSIQTSSIDVNLSSGTNMRISGKTDIQKINLSSGSSYDALDFVSKSAAIDASSGSSAKINVSDGLDVNISSGGLVQYKGTPKISSDISSGATLKNIN